MTDDLELSDARTVIVIADGAAAEAAEQAVAANTLIASRVGLAAAATVIEEQSDLAAVLIETRGVRDLKVVPAVVAAAERARVQTVVAFAADQLDEVGSLLLGRDVVLLCDPDPVEFTAALALAALDHGGTVRDSSGEAARLQRLNAEVARFAETLAKLTATDREAAAGGADPFVGDRMSGFVAAPVEVDPGEIRRAIRARRLREDVFDRAGLFEDPAWDMLLDLFAAELERRQVSVSSLCIAAAVAPTTALRWIGKLIDAGLFDRRPDEFDRRRAFIVLTARASTAMRNYLLALRRAGLTIA